MFESTIHRLRIFQSVIESESFSIAAKKLRMTQPSISSHIKALEQELGKSLFIRHPGRKATLTEAGELLYAYTLEITSRTNQIEISLQKLQEKQKRVSLSVQPNIANNLLPSYLTLFSKTHPEIDILMYSQTQEAVIENVLVGKSELGIIMTLGPVEGLYSEILTYQNLELVIGRTHELADRTSIEPNELEQYPFVGGLKTSNHSKMIDRALKKIGINKYNSVLQLEDYKTVIEVVKRGLGITCMTAFSVEGELKAGDLIRLQLQAEPIKIEIQIIYNSELNMSDEARLFMVFLRREMNNT